METGFRHFCSRVGGSNVNENTKQVLKFKKIPNFDKPKMSGNRVEKKAISFPKRWH